MWKKPTIKKPNLKQIGGEKLTKKETTKIAGGASEETGYGVGTCLGLGYGCWSIGTIRFGICGLFGAWYTEN